MLAAYGTMYGVQRTTVYLPAELKAALQRTAEAEDRSEADLLREGVRMVTERHANPDPRLPLFDSGDPTLSEQVEAALEE